MKNFIEIKGARCHNLKNISLKIPNRKLVVITGPSGSGKSSLAFDTLYAEGQRRYVESLSAYARQFLEQMPKPEVDAILGIHPAIAIQQKVPSGNPRSTVGTVTEIYDYLRLLFARIGDIHCPNCGHLIQKDQPEDVIKYINSLPLDTPYYIAFQLNLPEQKQVRKFRELILSRGFLRVWQNGQLINLSKEKLKSFENLFIIVDRGKQLKQLDRSRLVDSIETAFYEGEGITSIIHGSNHIRTFSQNFLCSNCGYKMIEPQPRLFSFNNPFGACPGCQGFGDMMDYDMQKIIPDPNKSLRDGAIAPWNTPAYRHILAKLATIAPQYGISMIVPFAHLTDEQRKIIIDGSSDFVGIKRFFKHLERKKYKVHVRVFMSRYRSYFTCTECQGNRLRPESLAVTIARKNISTLAKMSIEDLLKFFQNLKLSDYKQNIATEILKEIIRRLKYLYDVGLSYLNLDRRANTLSGGEFQRINLATAVGSALTETLYILDEPTIGLHPRDTGKLINILKSLAKMGNSVIVVEHDPVVIRHASHIIDLGPASGEEGGRIIFEGRYDELLKRGKGLTAEYLQGSKSLLTKTQFRKIREKFLMIKGAREHNLKNLTVKIPLEILVAITGVSGSGKSTLIYDILYRGYQSMIGKIKGQVGKHDDIVGVENLQNIIMVDQSPIGKTPRSNPITYIKGFDEIRKLFSNTTRARAQNLKPKHFSFNVHGGRCEVCEGTGQLKIEMQFLADIYIECEACKGKRFKPEILNIYFKGKNIWDVLELNVNQALEFFREYPIITRKLQILKEVGLGYLKLGQPATTLSGGEAQRIKLAAHLSQKNQQNILFLLDEPTTGLHFDDISKLLNTFERLIERGASVLVIEHNLDVINHADWIIDLGPEGGDAGGKIITEGTPKQVADCSSSYTGRFLKNYKKVSDMRRIKI